MKGKIRYHKLNSVLWVGHMIALAGRAKVSLICPLYSRQFPESKAAEVLVRYRLLSIWVRLGIRTYLAMGHSFI